MKPTVRWQALAAALEDAWPIGLAFCGTVGALAVGWISSYLLSTTLCDAVRYAGMLLQILGVWTVARGLMRLRRALDEPLAASMSAWFGRVVAAFSPQKPVALEVSVVEHLQIVGCEAELIHAAGPGASPEQRLSILEENVKHLRDELKSKIQGVRGDLASVTNALQQEQQDRRAADEETKRTIKDVAIGGLYFELVGVVWLIVGVIFTSIPAGMAAGLSLLPLVSRSSGGCS